MMESILTLFMLNQERQAFANNLIKTSTISVDQAIAVNKTSVRRKQNDPNT